MKKDIGKVKINFVKTRKPNNSIFFPNLQALENSSNSIKGYNARSVSCIEEKKYL